MLVRMSELRFMDDSLPQNGSELLNFPGFPSDAHSVWGKRFGQNGLNGLFY